MVRTMGRRFLTTHEHSVADFHRFVLFVTACCYHTSDPALWHLHSTNLRVRFVDQGTHGVTLPHIIYLLSKRGICISNAYSVLRLVHLTIQ